MCQVYVLFRGFNYGVRSPKEELKCIRKTNGVAETPPISENSSASCTADKFATSDGSFANASNGVDVREVRSLVEPHCARNVYG